MPCKVEDLRTGSVVRALRDLDPKGANVAKGDLGAVFGDANLHGDDAGPLVHWFKIELHQLDDDPPSGGEIVCRGTCNVYEGDVELVVGVPWEAREAKRKEAVEAALSRILSDFTYGAPEVWAFTQEKIETRLRRMAEWLLPGEGYKE